MSKILDDETDPLDELLEVIETNDIVNYKFSPINFVKVERSFKIYKNLLSDRRSSFKFENISQIIVIQCDLIFSYFISVDFAL